MDFMPLRLNSSSLTCLICSLAAIILHLVAMECQKLHMVDSPIGFTVRTCVHMCMYNMSVNLHKCYVLLFPLQFLIIRTFANSNIFLVP